MLWTVTKFAKGRRNSSHGTSLLLPAADTRLRTGFSLERECGRQLERCCDGARAQFEAGRRHPFFKDTLPEEVQDIWIKYFDLDRDYTAICESFSADESLKTACSEYPGIRILKQDEWETLCSFIISQNNNIPRIKGIIERLCESFGERLPGGGYSFPSAEKLAPLEPEDLAPLRAGFRNKYIIDAARKVAGGEVNLSALKSAEDDEVRESLLK